MALMKQYIRNINKTKKLILLLICSFVASNSFADHLALLPTFYAVNYPPYEIENVELGGLRGFDVDTIEASFKALGHDVSFAFLPWTTIMKHVKRGTVAGVFSCAYTEDRSKFIFYSDPISYETRSIMMRVNEERDQIASLKDLKKYEDLKVIAARGYVQSTELEKQNIRHYPARSDNEAMEMLLNNEGDAFYTTREYAEYLVKQKGIRSKYKFVDIEKHPYHLCVSQKWPESKKLVSILNKGLKIIQDNGEYDAIHANYK